jgi:hypothetical protein
LGVTGATTLSAALTGTDGTFSGHLSMTGTDYFVPAKGTTAQRPGSPTEGYSRFNSTLHLPEFYDGSAWRQPSIAQPISAGFKNLVIQNNAVTPNSQIDVDADAITVEKTDGTAYRLTSVNLTINCATTGANALDGGGLANSTWYSVWVIYNPTTDTTAGLASTSATAPTMPSGYTAKARVGWFRTNGSAQFHRILQKGRKAQYVVSASVTTVLPNIASGAAGTFSTETPVFASVSVSNVVPSTANEISIVAMGNFNNGASANVYVAPNTSYSGIASANSAPVYVIGGNVSAALGVFALESTNIAWVSGGSGGGVNCLGWSDNI